MEHSRVTESTIYLCAPVNALVEGIFQGQITLGEIRRHGDFGLGTFDRLDGEMVMLDGVIYQITGEGRVQVIEDNQQVTPFVCLTSFTPMSTESLSDRMEHADFMNWLQELMPSPNIFYAFRIRGMFEHIKVRSVSRQESWRPLVEIAAEQAEFTFTKIKGTIAGFFTPAFMASVNVPGLHLHFLAEDGSGGGHLLECVPADISVEVQLIPRLELSLPMSLDYLTCDFQRDIAQDLDKVER